MKDLKYIFILATAFTACNTSSEQNGNLKNQPDSLEKDSVAAPVRTKERKDTVIISETHLKDTTFIKGSFVLFLCPDEERFNSYTKDPESGIYDTDMDFGVGIAATTDSISKNKKYKNIKTDISRARYIVINDCKSCPLTIDRDTIDYGFILSAKGKEIRYASDCMIHSGDYLEDVDAYFNIKRSTVK